MENFTSAVRAVCIVSAGICLIKNMTGGTKLKTHMELLLKLIFALVLLAPLVKGGIGLELPDFSGFSGGGQSYSTELYDNELIRQTSENISEVLQAQIEAAGLSCDKIVTEVNISEDSSISISRVIISSEQFEAAAEIIRSSLGAETEVVNGGN